jgi:carbonic anhydrase
MQDLIDSVLKLQRGAFPESRELFKKLAASQAPRTPFIACSESHMVPGLVTHRETGRKY